MTSEFNISADPATIPLPERVKLLRSLEVSIADEQIKLAEAGLKADLQLVVSRLNCFDAGPLQSLNFADIKRIAFEES